METFVEKITSRTAIQPITPQIAVLADQLPPTYLVDLCDRLIRATALAGAFLLVTKDRNIRECKQIRTIW